MSAFQHAANNWLRRGSHSFPSEGGILLSQLSALNTEFKREFDFKAMDEDDPNQPLAARTGAYGDYSMNTRVGDYADF